MGTPPGRESGWYRRFYGDTPRSRVGAGCLTALVVLILIWLVLALVGLAPWFFD